MGLTEYGHIATEETQLRVANLLQAIAAGSAGPEYTDATFKALLDDTKLKSCETDTAPGFGRGYALRAHGGASSRTPRPCTKGHGNRKPLHISKYFYETKI